MTVFRLLALSNRLCILFLPCTLAREYELSYIEGFLYLKSRLEYGASLNVSVYQLNHTSHRYTQVQTRQWQPLEMPPPPH